MRRTRQPRRAVQLSLDEARRPTGRGGWRPRAGRRPGRTTCSHGAREHFAARHPQHVTLRVVPGVASLRRERAVKVVRRAIEAGGRADAFRVVHFNVQGNHLHLLCEADGATALARGMQGLNVRLARGLNAVLGRKGTLFAERYHARTLRTPREVRTVLRYVLLNARRHASERGETLSRYWLDPYSTAPWFDGWRQRIRADEPWLQALVARPCPAARARTWLLTAGWRLWGLLDVDDVPGPSTRRGHAAGATLVTIG